MTAIRDRERFRKLSLLQLSNDPVVARGWFANVQDSVYGAANSIDIQRIDRPDGSFGCIVCSHILEHVLEPRRAFRELGRVLTDEGLLFLAYPAPCILALTVDWGFPASNRHGHYRVFGRDEAEYHTLLPYFYVIAVEERDDVTGDGDILYLVTKDYFWINRVRRSPFVCRLISQPDRSN